MKLKGKILDIDALNAYRTAYANPIQRKEILVSLMIPFLVAFGFTFILYYYWWLSLVAGGVAMAYACVCIMPYREERVYQDNAFRERNNFINNMTQILTSNERTVFQALETVNTRANGEFREDLEKLRAKISSATNEEVQEAFIEVGNKYEKDVIFSLYMEQLVTIVTEGKMNIETLKDVKTYHNEVKKKQERFYKEKQQREKEFKTMVNLNVIFILGIAFTFEFNQYIEMYAHHFIGWIANFGYLVMLVTTYHSFLRRMKDDSVMEVRV